MIIPCLLDDQLFGEKYLSGSDEDLEKRLEEFETYITWPISQSVWEKVNKRLNEAISSEEKKLAARAQTVKQMLNNVKFVFLENKDYEKCTPDELAVYLLENVDNITGMFAEGSDRCPYLADLCNEKVKPKICPINDPRGNPLRKRYLLFNKGSVSLDRGSFAKEISTYCFWSQKIQIVDRYLASNCYQYFYYNDLKYKASWKECRDVLHELYQMWRAGENFSDRDGFHIVTFGEYKKGSKKDSKKEFSYSELQDISKDIAGKMAKDLYSCGLENIKIRINHTKDCLLKHDRYIVSGDNDLAVGVPSGISSISQVESGNVDFYRRTSRGNNDKIFIVLKSHCLAEEITRPEIDSFAYNPFSEL